MCAGDGTDYALQSTTMSLAFCFCLSLQVEKLALCVAAQPRAQGRMRTAEGSTGGVVVATLGYDRDTGVHLFSRFTDTARGIPQGPVETLLRSREFSRTFGAAVRNDAARASLFGPVSDEQFKEVAEQCLRELFSPSRPCTLLTLITPPHTNHLQRPPPPSPLSSVQKR